MTEVIIEQAGYVLEVTLNRPEKKNALTQALEWGLVNQVVTDVALLSTARNVAARLAALPPEAVRQTKALIKHGHADVAGRIEQELALFHDRLRSPEAMEAFQAFAEKRQPDFSRFS